MKKINIDFEGRIMFIPDHEEKLLASILKLSILIFLAIINFFLAFSLLSSNRILAAESAATPLLLRTRVDSEYYDDIRQKPLSPATISYLQDLARKYDLVLMDVGNANPEAYKIMHQVNPDIILQDYANPRNWAGNIFSLSEVKEEWFLHEPYYSRRCEDRLVSPYYRIVNDCNAYNEWEFDIGNPDFQQFFASKVVESLQTGLDGIEMDNGAIICYWMGECARFTLTGREIVPTNPRTGEKYTREDWNKDTIKMAKTVREAVDKAFPSGVSKNGVPITITVNAGRILDYYYSNVSDYLWQVIDYYQGVLIESSYFYINDSQESWEYELKGTKEIMRRGYPFLRWCGGQNLFSYASTLLAAGASGDRFYNSNDWEGFKVDIGTAIGDYYLFPGSKNIFARRYTKALVLVNPSQTTETINPGIPYRYFTNFPSGLSSNYTQNPITLSGRSATILMTETITPSYFKGDVNHSNSNDAVNLQDTLLTLINWNKNSKFVSGYWEPVADNKINTLDFGWVVKEWIY